MPNPYFRFKEFTVYQDRCAMKVTTEACLLGAWVAAQKLPAQKVLDIGGGTGLLTLMLAQQMKAELFAIEKETDAFEQMKENFDASPWRNTLFSLYGDVLQYETSTPFDLIITNPPFYENDLPSPDRKKNMAHHDASLTLSKLMDAIARLITKDGCFVLLLPYTKTPTCIELAAANGFKLSGQLKIRQTTNHNFFRSILLFSASSSSPHITELSIKDDTGNYSHAFSELLKSYYLYL